MTSLSKRKIRTCLVGLCLPVIFGLAYPPVAFADPTPPTVAPRPSASQRLSKEPFSLAVSPARLAITPEQLATTQQLSVINRGQDPFDVVVQKRDFVAASDGSLEYQEDVPYGAANWLTVEPKRFTLASGETQVITADFDVPNKPELGDHQVAIVFMVLAGKEGGNIKVNRGVAAPVFLTVPGPIDDTVRLTGLTGPGFSMIGNPDLTANLENVGTVHRDFRGPTALNLSAAGETTRFPDFTVPRDSNRNVTTSWTPPLVCICHPTVAFSNADGAVQSATIRVVIFPWWLAAGLLILGLSIFSLTWYRRRQSHRTLVTRLTRATAVSSGGG